MHFLLHFIIHDDLYLQFNAYQFRSMNKIKQALLNLGKLPSFRKTPSVEPTPSQPKPTRSTSTPPAQPTVSTTQSTQLATKPATNQSKGPVDKYRRYKKTGPQLLVTRILMVNGPLTSKQIWRVYQRMLLQNKSKGLPEQLQYWPSLTKLKQTIKNMRMNEKVVTNGYMKAKRLHKGWLIKQKLALRYVHPQVIQLIQKEIAQRETL